MTKNAKSYELIYAAEPKTSPLRMQCKKCNAAPGEKCKTVRGTPMDNYHDARNSDFKLLRDAEAKMQQWDRQYGKKG
jgi:hypothetical protein